MDDSVQCRSNPRIEYFKNWHSNYSYRTTTWHSNSVTEHEDFKSSTESTISTFLINDIASVRNGAESLFLRQQMRKCINSVHEGCARRQDQDCQTELQTKKAQTRNSRPVDNQCFALDRNVVLPPRLQAPLALPCLVGPPYGCHSHGVGTLQ